MRRNGLLGLAVAAALLWASGSTPAAAGPEKAIESVVSVLPVWPGRAQGGAGARPGVAPEGSGVALAEPGVIATAWHVVAPAERIDVRLSDGRVTPARLIARDVATDIALLRIEATPPLVELAPKPGLADPVCAIGNAYGLGLSVACGVVSALDVTEAGFNAVEAFVQTDAAANPGSSGGALVDGEGRLVGMVSAIFASEGDANIGVNFAVSTELLTRVADALLAEGEVAYLNPQWRLERQRRGQRAEIAAARVADLVEGGPASAAGLAPGDRILRIGSRRIRKPRDAVAALALARPQDGPVAVVFLREGEERTVSLAFDAASAPRQETRQETPQAAETLGDCPHPAPVCLARQAVFPISSFDPLGSATRIGPGLLVTNRHVVGDRTDAVVYTPAGPRGGVVVASAYLGDLALVSVEGLPPEGMVFSPEGAAAPGAEAAFFAIGADVGRQEVRVFDPGALLAAPAADAPLSRLHVTAMMQPGVSGGALVDETGALVGIAVGGGEGRYEAIPLRDVQALLALRDSAEAATIQKEQGAALAACEGALTGAEAAPRDRAAAEAVVAACAQTANQGQFLNAGRVLAQAGIFEEAIGFLQRAVEQTPNSLNARLSLLVSLQLGGRFEEMTPHARWAMAAAPEDPQALRFAIQSGVWGGDPALAEEGYEALLKADPRQAEAARRFIDNAPPAPPRR